MTDLDSDTDVEVEELADAVGVDPEVIVEKVKATSRLAESDYDD